MSNPIHDRLLREKRARAEKEALEIERQRRREQARIKEEIRRVWFGAKK